ncbi:hypothetical protein [Rhodococcus sp. USK13]|uniref:hypothetical protein n=1 Tax=Rhodococcus sp. USK13 TaxID=2806442 RepID=UPI001BCA9D74|nr:hypothetical protein [Rhodococcus sp. USK13]
MSVTDRLLLPRYAVSARAVARAAMEGDRMFGTVEVTVEVLAELLERQVLPVTRRVRRTDGATGVCRAARSDDRPLRAG